MVEKEPTSHGDDEDGDDDDELILTKDSDNFILSALLNPFKYATTLIQLGYEPMPPQFSHTIFSYIGVSKPLPAYPWKGTYVNYLRRQIGIVDLMTTGVFSNMLKDIFVRMNNATLSSYILQNQVSHVSNSKSVDCVMEETHSLDFIMKLFQMALIKLWNVILTQPFQVIAIRQMACFIGGELQYRWFPQAVVSVYRENGVSGYFQGLVPRLIGEVTLQTLYYFLNRIFRRHVIGLHEDPNGVFLTVWRACTWLFTSQFVYPSKLVSTVMSVRGSHMAASNLCEYPDWLSCWRSLVRENQSKRGSKIFSRTHVQAVHLQALI